MGGFWFCFGVFLGSLTSLSLREYSSSSLGATPPNDYGGSVFVVGDPKVQNDWFNPKRQFDMCPQRSDLSSKCTFTCRTSKADSQSEFSFEGGKYEAFAIET